jgi:hypothetical protein
MIKDPDLGNAYLDVALVGATLSTVGVVVDLISRGTVDPWLLATALITNAAYIIGALRLGASPLGYVRNVFRRGSLPR